jgi:hypothetical protein
MVNPQQRFDPSLQYFSLSLESNRSGSVALSNEIGACLKRSTSVSVIFAPFMFQEFSVHTYW